jgi:transcriptional regulator with XRE-family HTH domain
VTRQEAGAVLKALRTKRKLTLRDVAEATGRTFPTISKIENGHEEAGRGLLIQFAGLYGIGQKRLFRMVGRCPHCMGSGRLP